MVAWGCAVWGSGWYYPPYYGGFYGGYPYYRPYYPTYGYGASYNPWTGAYSRGAVAYGPYGGAGVGARYNPRTGTYSRGAAAYGPYGSRGAGQAYNPRTGAYGQTRAGLERLRELGRRRRPARRPVGPDRARDDNRATGTTTRATRTDSGAAQPSRGAARARDPASCGRAAATSTPAGTATSTASRAAAGRSTTTGTGARPSGPRAGSPGPRARDRSSTTGPPAACLDHGQLNRDYSARARRARSARATTAATAERGRPQQRQLVPFERGRRSPRTAAGVAAAEPLRRRGRGRTTDSRRGHAGSAIEREVGGLGLGLAVGGEAPRAAAQARRRPRPPGPRRASTASSRASRSGTTRRDGLGRQQAAGLEVRKDLITEIEKFKPGDPMIVIYRQVGPNDKRVTAVAFPGTAQKPTYKNLTGERVTLRSAPLVNGACGPADRARSRRSRSPGTGSPRSTDGCWCCASAGTRACRATRRGSGSPSS